MSSRFPGLALAIAAVVAACGPMSDSATHQRQAERERKAGVRAMQAATAQTARGREIGGDELRILVSGKTHVSQYERGPGGAQGPYIEYSWFRPDGRFVYMNSLWALDPEGKEGDAWRVDGDALCIRNSSFTSEEQCYRLALTPDGKIQYYIHQPGEDSHGLLTKIPDRVIDGPPPPRP
jgi:hypothetical protein